MFFGLLDISKQALVDEPLWAYDRIEQYWHNLAEGDLHHVRPSDKPGVTIAILGGYGLTKHVRPHEIRDTETPEFRSDLIGAMRIPIVLAVTALLPLFFYLVMRLLGTKIAIASLAFIAVSPILIGVTRILNPDALLWILLPLTLLSFLLQLQQRNWTHIILTGILLGLGLLTKYVMNILLIVLPLAIVVHALYHTTETHHMRTLLKKNFRGMLWSILVALLAYCLLLPSIWVRPEHILEGTILSQAFEPIWKFYVLGMIVLIADLYASRTSLITHLLCRLTRWKQHLLPSIAAGWLGIITVTIVTAYLQSPFDYQLSLQSPKASGRDLGFLTTFFADFYVLIFAIGIPILISFLIGLYLLARKSSQALQWLYAILLLFPPLYYLGSAISGVTTILRYQVAAFPLVFIVAAYGLTQILNARKTAIQIAVSIVVAGILLLNLFMARPYYFSFVSELLPQDDVLNIKDMGDGSYQAAMYLNALPGAREMTIWADKAGVCAVFVGSCETTVTASTIAEQKLVFDYFVTSRTRKHLTERHAPRHRRKEDAPAQTYHFERLYSDDVPVVHEILPSKRKANYIRIIDADDFDIFTMNDDR